MVVPGSPLPRAQILQTTSWRDWKMAPDALSPSLWQNEPVLGLFAARGVQGLNNKIITIILPA